MSISSELDKKDFNAEKFVKKTLDDKKILTELIEGVLSKKDQIRFNSHKVLTILSEKHPEMIYSKWSFFEELLSSENNYHKFIGLNTIANLTKYDKENKFEKIFDKYYNILSHNSTMVVGHVATKSGIIAKAKPNLQSKITDKLLNIDSIHKGKQIELVKAYVIDAFDEYFNETKNKKEIMDFVKKQTSSESPKTRKKAKEFIEKWEKTV